MKVVDLAIKKQIDDSYAIVAKLQDQLHHIKDVILNSRDNPEDLQETFTLYIEDDEALQVDVLSQLQVVTH
ncbi:hypothetical protein B14_200029 (plasmid) [Bacillus licheniformis]|uniref:hypothetical protein n=1 Tax=Bacillus licheniformis TaxID=1402 RepID=UPI0009B7A985|nr:hypothetical protein [Bacillus licheniformis]ARC67240.1 hypothetical protein B14_200029 [Bacillus licheniformis]ARW46120.1 hypothetical protein S100141_04900 [Bacillus licheniformis]MDE1421897.1 hypothetical protein [Bacillus licheniformis]MEC0475902.1 hypothetical protein [Bacillus licheniformis]QAS18770.1 hypothetical protein EQJ69_22880 [Bacillus licheniformis]